MDDRKSNSGFTVIELVIVIVFLMILFNFITSNLLSVTQQTSVNTQITVLINDLKNQQLKAMAGNTGVSGVPEGYGVFFDINRYILFRGDSYSQANPDNFVINLNPNLSFASITFPDSQIVFSRLSGEIAGFDPEADTFILRNSINGEQKTVTLNSLGVITGVN